MGGWDLVWKLKEDFSCDLHRVLGFANMDETLSGPRRNTIQSVSTLGTGAGKDYVVSPDLVAIFPR